MANYLFDEKTCKVPNNYPIVKQKVLYFPIVVE